MKFDKPTLITLTAPTCSGKSFLLELLTDHLAIDRSLYRRKEVKGLCERIVSTTTRKPREGEIEGKDYFFISEEESRNLEEHGMFAELITFRGTRYGVTKIEMEKKMTGDRPPIVILEPQGLKVYEQYCREHGWDMFKVFVSTPEPLRIERLKERTSIDVRNAVFAAYEKAEPGVMFHIPGLQAAEKVINTHTDRLLSITGDERTWMGTYIWDAIVPGDNAKKAIADIKLGVDWRNRRQAPPKPYEPAHHQV